MSSINSLDKIFKSDDFKKSVNKAIDTYALPTLLASLGAGAIGSYLSSKNKIRHESEKARRKRVLRSALTPALTAAAAVAALGGVDALSNLDAQKLIDDDGILSNIHPIDFVLKNGAIPLGIALGINNAKLSLVPKSKGTLDFGAANKNIKVKDLGIFNTNVSKENPHIFGKELSKKFKKLPKIYTTKGLASVLGSLGLGLGGGVLADKAINTFFF